MMTFQKAQKILENLLKEIDPDINFSTLRIDEPLKSQIQFDSLDFLDLSILLKKKYGVPVIQTDYPQLKTLQDWCNYLIQKTSSDDTP